MCHARVWLVTGDRVWCEWAWFRALSACGEKVRACSPQRRKEVGDAASSGCLGAGPCVGSQARVQ